MSVKRHILVCGEVGVGKTTLLRRLLERSRRPLYGFVTKRLPVPGEDGLYQVRLCPASPEGREWERTSGELAGLCGQRREAYPRAFDGLGVQLLQAPAEGLILMDELGFLENRAEAFRAAVLKALDGDVPVLAAVKTRDTPFLRQVRDHHNARLAVVTPENRDRLFQQLLPQVLQWDRELQ